MKLSALAAAANPSEHTSAAAATRPRSAPLPLIWVLPVKRCGAEHPPRRRPDWAESYNSGPGEAPPGGGRFGLRDDLGHRVGVRPRLLGLELREPLGRQLARVLLLDALEPLGACPLLGGVDGDPLGLGVLVDLDEQLV